MDFGPSNSGLLGNSDWMNHLRGRIAEVAGEEDPVLIVGETGTGKELVASALHYSSHRRNKPYVAVNCSHYAAMKELLRSELFGYEKGAFTDAKKTTSGLFETAGEGTLFLDEIGNLPEDVQANLLRAIDNREIYRVGGKTAIPIKCRLVLATNQTNAKNYGLREDMFYRLPDVIKTVELRKWHPDVVLIFLHYLDVEWQRRAEGRPLPDSIELSMLWALIHHEWPGNVRELKAVAKRYAREKLSDIKEGNVDGLLPPPSFCNSVSGNIGKGLGGWDAIGLHCGPMAWWKYGSVPISNVRRFFSSLERMARWEIIEEDTQKFLFKYFRKAEAEWDAFVERVRGTDDGKWIDYFSAGGVWVCAELPSQQIRRKTESAEEEKNLPSKYSDGAATITTDSGAFIAQSDLSLSEVKVRYIRFILDRCNGNQSQASQALGINRNTLRRLLTEDQEK